MPLYEHVFIARQDISSAQAENLIEQFSNVITENGGSIVKHEYWGVRPMAYKINKNRKGHYSMLHIDAPAPAVKEMERQMRLHDDVMRAVSFRVDAHEEGPSAIMQSKSSRDDRRGGRDRDRDRAPRRPEGEARTDAPKPDASEKKE